MRQTYPLQIACSFSLLINSEKLEHEVTKNSLLIL